MTSERDLKLFLIGSALLVLSALPYTASAQCGVVIDAFPYTEDFESGPAWTTGGLASDWEWGTPAKPLIDGPGGGQYSWVVGGLTDASYNDGQQSWLESPCFDLSDLPYPWITFKIFWETERLYDGLGFQYSLNEGATWTNLGNFGAPEHCLRTNWFNSSNITGLELAQPRQGWSGRLGNTVGICAGGEGSGQWLTATHCLAPVAGESLVKFRFVFGAGTICNAYDGIAIDDVLITTAPPNVADISYACFGLTVEFEDLSEPCPDTWSWDFDDPGSGAANTSNEQSPVHTFSAPGTYQVRLAVAGPCNAPDTVVVPITVISVELEAVDPGCDGDDGTLTAVVNGAGGPFTYAWSNGETGTSVITGLPEGVYGLIVEGADICPAEATAQLVQQDTDLLLEVVVQEIDCPGAANGEATVEVSGGTGPFTFDWSPLGGNTPTASGLAPGTYTCTVSDAVGCTANVSVTITEPPLLVVQAPDTLELCSGISFTLSAMAQGGTTPYDFQWTPEGPEIVPEEDMVYSVVVVDANGCISETLDVFVSVGGPAPPVFTLDEPVGCAPHCVTFSAQVMDGISFAWDFGDGSPLGEGPQPVHCFDLAGSYTVSLTATDAAGCTSTASLPDVVQVDPTPAAAFIADPPVTTIEAPTVQFIDASVGALAWQWSFGDPDGSGSQELSPTFTYTEVGCYDVVLQVQSGAGCTDEATTVVCVEDAFVVHAPNAFTPNGDGINDRFNVVTSVASPAFFSLELFDRWGRVLHVSTAPLPGWDGTSAGGPVPDGVYAWRLRLRDTTGQLRERMGHVTLVR